MRHACRPSHKAYRRPPSTSMCVGRPRRLRPVHCRRRSLPAAPWEAGASQTDASGSPACAGHPRKGAEQQPRRPPRRARLRSRRLRSRRLRSRRRRGSPPPPAPRLRPARPERRGPVTSYKLQVTSYELRVTSYELRVTSYTLQSGADLPARLGGADGDNRLLIK